MPKRRSHGDGGIHWDESKNRWIAAVYVGYTAAGRRRRITASAKTKTGAREKLKVKLREAENRAALNSKGYTVGQAVVDWFAHSLHSRGESTVKTLRSLADNHVIPELGARKLRELSADEVDEWLGEKAKSLSTDTLRRLHSILRRSITRAQARSKVDHNVAMLCEIPKGTSGRPSKALTMAQAEALLEAAERSPMRAYIVVSMLTGAREPRNCVR